jgi:hypothetical protein
LIFSCALCQKYTLKFSLASYFWYTLKNIMNESSLRVHALAGCIKSFDERNFSINRMNHAHNCSGNEKISLSADSHNLKARINLRIQNIVYKFWAASREHKRHLLIAYTWNLCTHARARERLRTSTTKKIWLKSKNRISQKSVK